MMVRALRRHFLLLISMVAVSSGQQFMGERPQSPIIEPWSDAEWEQLQSGDLLPGYVLLYLRTDPDSEVYDRLLESELELPEAEIVEQPSDLPPVIDLALIPDRDLVRYFSGKPENFLSDVQGLLSVQAFRDREAFLKFHSNDSQIPIYIFLFRGEQDVPQEFPAQVQLRKQLYSEDDAVLVYYHLGEPRKSRLAMSESLRRKVSQGDYRRALESAIAEAEEKSDEVDQLENFAVQLSIRLYWIERNLRESESQAAAEAFDEALAQVPEPLVVREMPQWWEDMKLPVIIGLIVLGAAALGVVGRLIAVRRRVYLFPEPDFAGRLGAPHAAGVGAVLTFRSKRLPPTAQKEQVPNYLETY